jgi:hypothetical protein
MPGSTSSWILNSYLDVDCPECTYPIWVRGAEIIVGLPVVCPCCRLKIFLRDADSSVRRIGETLDRTIDAALKGAFK